MHLIKTSENTKLLHDTIETCLLSAYGNISRFLSVTKESIVLQEWGGGLLGLYDDVGCFLFKVSTFEMPFFFCFLSISDVSNLQLQNPLKEQVV